MRTIIFLIVLVIMSSCESQKVRLSDLNSWTNRDLIELQKHPYFSVLTREERKLTNGEELINFTDKRIVTSGNSSCLGVGSRFGYGNFGTSFCQPPEYKESNCVHQFIAKDNKIKSYNVIGDGCYTDCRNTPNKKTCSKNEH